MPAGFLELSAELRNQVYHEALTHDRQNGQIATVALLRACRQIHNEAQGILHAQSTFLISVSPVEGGHWINGVVGAESSLEFSGDCLDPPSYLTTTSERVARAFPSAVLKVPKIKVRIQVLETLPRGSVEIPDQPIDRFIEALCRHLNLNQRNRHLEVTLINKEGYAGNISKALDDFEGLVYLGPHVDLKLHLFNDVVEEYVQIVREAILDFLRDTITGEIDGYDGRSSWDGLHIEAQIRNQ